MGIVKEEAVIGFEDDEVTGTEVRKKKKSASSKKSSGGFQSMGLSFPILKGIQKRGYKVPTPIQRKTIPLVVEGRDVVAMARTGSGKTACFLIPMFEKLKKHDTKHGIRALILSPTRELALQTLKFTKQLGRYTALRSAIVLGGDSMETQFSSLHSSPDIVIATPGRFLHVCLEMDLKLNNIQYIVFDEADRLFEMGFGEQLFEIVRRLPEQRQTVLFSATLPKVLVEFARAGLSDPVLIRLDVESKLPDTLSTMFIACRPEEKPAALLCLLKYVVKPKAQTIVFAATKHHVEYLHALLDIAGISNSYIYSDLDASARKINVAKFEMGKVSTLVVTDVAARGIDIPLLDNVVNYNFPAKAKLFVHRVGRCARAGRTGSAYCLVSSDEVCYMLDLHLFLGRPLNLVPPDGPTVSTEVSAFGKIPQHLLESELSQIINWQTETSDLASIFRVSENAYKQYVRSRPGASLESVRRSKDISVNIVGEHPLFVTERCDDECDDKKGVVAATRQSLVAGINMYRPQGTIFEIGQCSKSDMYTVMKKKREKDRTKIQLHKKKCYEKETEKQAILNCPNIKLELSQPEDVRSTFSKVIVDKRKMNSDGPRPKRLCTVDKEHYIPYQPADQHTEQGLAVNDFQRDASAAELDLTADTERALKSRVQKKVWDRKKKKMVGVQDSKAGKIKSESGAWIPATYKSGRYKQWMDKMKTPQHQSSFIEEEDTQKESETKRLQTPNTHWGRHNMKVTQRKVKSDMKRPEQILKERERKERMRKRHGKKKRRNKK